MCSKNPYAEAVTPSVMVFESWEDAQAIQAASALGEECVVVSVLSVCVTLWL